MTEILTSLYISDLLGEVKEFFFVLQWLFIIAFFLGLAISFTAISIEDEKCYINGTRMKKFIFTVFLPCIFICWTIQAVIPGENIRNLYIAVKTMDKAYENEHVKEISDKVVLLVNQKLNELIEPVQEKAEKVKKVTESIKEISE